MIRARVDADADTSEAGWPAVAALAGVGLMGTGFAQLLALAGVRTLVADATPELARAGRERAIALAAGFERSGLMAAGAADAIADGVSAVASIEEAAGEAGFLLEAVSESPAAKHEVYRRVEAVIADDAVIASNTSAIPIRELAVALRRPQRFVGTHWFNPPQWIPCVEVIPGPETSEATLTRVGGLLARLGKTPVRVGDAGGFVANRLQFAMYKEAVAIVADGVASAAEVDEVVRTSFGFRLPLFGPFAIADMAGLDVYAGAYAALEADLGERFAAPGELTEMVGGGRLGVKAGGGFSPLDPGDAERVARWRDRGYVALARLMAELGADGDAPPR